MSSFRWLCDAHEHHFRITACSVEESMEDDDLPPFTPTTIRVNDSGVPTPIQPLSPIEAALMQEGGFAAHLQFILQWFRTRKSVMKKTEKSKKAQIKPEVKAFLEEVADERAALGRWAEPNRAEIRELGPCLAGIVYGPKMVAEEVCRRTALICS